MLRKKFPIQRSIPVTTLYHVTYRANGLQKPCLVASR